MFKAVQNVLQEHLIRSKMFAVWFARRTVFVLINYLRNGKVRRYKYVHLMFNDKFNRPFSDFLSRHFNVNEHLVICERILRHPMPTGMNVMKAWTFRGFDFSSASIKKVFCHSLCENELVDILMAHQEVLHKAYWIIWGGDLYNAPRDAKNDFVRSHFGGWVTVADGDACVAEKIYGRPLKVYNARYTTPITAAMVREAKEFSIDRVRDGGLCVQINNSCDESTIEMLKVLSKYSSENIHVRTIVSYGKTQYRDKIIECGKRLFGSRFSAIDVYMSPREYSRYMASNDVIVFNQNRQQGLGNINLAIALGVKVFVRSEVSSYAHYTRLGVIVYDTDSISELSFEDFACMPENVRANNLSKGLSMFDEELLARLWRPIFAV